MKRTSAFVQCRQTDVAQLAVDKPLTGKRALDCSFAGGDGEEGDGEKTDDESSAKKNGKTEEGRRFDEPRVDACPTCDPAVPSLL